MQNYRTPSSSIVIVAFGDSVLGVDTRTGKRVWQKKVGALKNAVVRIAFAKDCVFAMSERLTCLVVETGEIRWTVDLPRPGGTFLVENDQIFIGSGGNVWCRSTANGDILWTDGYEGLGTADVAFGFPGNLAQADERH